MGILPEKIIKLKPAVLYGVILFCCVILITGYLTPGYSQLHHALSELGAPNAPYARLVRWFGFIPLGVSFLIYADQSRRLFSNKLPIALFLLTGLAIIAVGIFPTDPHGRRDTISGIIHAIAGIFLLSVLSLTPLVLTFPGQYKTPPRSWLLVFSFVMGILVSVFFIMLPNGISPQLIEFHKKVLGDYFVIWYPLHGLHQRLLLGIYFVWLLISSRFVDKTSAHLF